MDEEAKLKCQACGTLCDADDAFCMQCDAELNATPEPDAGTADRLEQQQAPAPENVPEEDAARPEPTRSIEAPEPRTCPNKTQ